MLFRSNINARGTRFPLRPARFSVYASPVLFVRTALCDSATDATLATGGWLTLSRQGFSPCKMHQASPGALTLCISFFGDTLTTGNDADITTTRDRTYQPHDHQAAPRENEGRCSLRSLPPPSSRVLVLFESAHVSTLRAPGHRVSVFVALSG